MTNDNNANDKESMTRLEFWQRSAAISFSLWTIVLSFLAYSGGKVIVNFEAQQNYLVTNIAAIERRLILVEERQRIVLETLHQINK
jgi:membrane protein DedA with SNARE-associated domain